MINTIVETDCYIYFGFLDLYIKLMTYSEKKKRSVCIDQKYALIIHAV